MLAYVFWHWKRSEVPAAEYETRLQAFHRALADAPPPNYHGSQAFAISKAPWANSGADAYEDWYFVDGFADLETLNESAISASRQVPHDAAAALAAGGSAGIYKLRMGQVIESPTLMCWFSKPRSLTYPQLFDTLKETLEQSTGAVWMRQMTLGPATESCLQLSLPKDQRVAIDLQLPDDGTDADPAAMILPRRVFPPSA